MRLGFTGEHKQGKAMSERFCRQGIIDDDDCAVVIENGVITAVGKTRGSVEKI